MEIDDSVAVYASEGRSEIEPEEPRVWELCMDETERGVIGGLTAALLNELREWCDRVGD